MAQVITNLATDVTAPINNVLMRGLLNAAKRTFPYFAGSVPGILENNQGSLTLRWDRIDNLSAATTALTELLGNAAFGMGRDLVNPSVSNVTATVSKYGNAIGITEELDFTQVNYRAARFLDNLGENAGHSLNLLQRDILDAATTVRLASSAATVTAIVTAIDANDIASAVNTLGRNSALKFFPNGFGSTNVGTSPIRSSYYGINHVDLTNDIRGISGFVSAEQYGGYTQLEVGEYGTVKGVRWIETEVGSIATSGGTTTATNMRGSTNILNDIYSTVIFGREAHGSVGLGGQYPEAAYMGGDSLPAVELIQHPPGSSGVGDAFNELGSLAWKAFHAGVILNQNFIVRVRSTATDPV